MKNWQQLVGVTGVLMAVFTPGLVLAHPQGGSTFYLAEAEQNPPTPGQLQANAEAFVDALFAQKFDQAWTFLAPQTQSENPPRVLMHKSRAFLKETGDFKQRIGSRVEGEVVVVNIQFANLTDDLILIFNQDRKIVGIDFPASADDLSVQPPPAN